ncbi:hypothetical protein ACJJWD_09575 [Comamonas testosteroni]|uniref:hypothetical protein n=1 Tax=Comamonas TaxID=283 RepID=UPI0021159F68|nr:hypothetical protein [Comamonas thiooxydans]UUE95345.1 hypothetical protein MJ608_06815 [Comamonas thiooxydans]
MKKRFAALLALLGISQHLSAQQKQELATAIQYSTPGAAASATAAGAKLMGFQLSEWLILSSIALVALQGGYLVWKWRRDYLRDEQREKDRKAGLRVADTDLGSLE